MKFTIIFFACFLAVALSSPIETRKPVDTLIKHEETHDEKGFNVLFETSEGVLVQSHGTRVEGPEGDVVHVAGSYAYTSPEGKLIKVNYIADENGFQPTGDHLPTVHH